MRFTEKLAKAIGTTIVLVPFYILVVWLSPLYGVYRMEAIIGVAFLMLALEINTQDK